MKNCFTKMQVVGALGMVGLVATLAPMEVLGNVLTTEQVDARVRTFITPQRILWQTNNVRNAQSLLKPRYGQITEEAWLRGSGCVLENKGTVPAVLLDFGRELHGGLQIENAEFAHGLKVRVRFGESVGEAMSELGYKGACNDHAVRDDIIEIPHLGQREWGNTGFRFVRIDLVTPGKLNLECVRAVSLMRDLKQLGTFRSSDERLNLVWHTAVRTVHLCMQEFLWDGIKRDRLVWMGDTHPETRAILSVFGATDVLKESLDYAAATTPPNQWMNGMDNYTLWFIRNVHDWYYYTGDVNYVLTRKAYLKATIEHVLAFVGEDGLSKLNGFLDWPTQHNQQAVKAGTQALHAIALDNASVLAEVFQDDKLAERCHLAAMRLRAHHPSPAGAKSAAALLALGGLADAKTIYRDVLGTHGLEGVSTFYGYYMLEAMSAAGENQHALDTVRSYWGAMLDMGATSFWEDFNVAWTNNATRLDQMPQPDKKDIHGDYGEFCYIGYRHSLCHGWSSGPAAWCINHILGLQVVDVGCKTVKVQPFLGDLQWAEGSIATPFGPVWVRHEKQPNGTIHTEIKAPDGVKIVK